MSIHNIDTRHLRTGDRVLVKPSPLTHNKFHRAAEITLPTSEWRTVAYTSPVEARPEMRNWRDVVFSEGGHGSAPASSTWVADISGRTA